MNRKYMVLRVFIAIYIIKIYNYIIVMLDIKL